MSYPNTGRSPPASLQFLHSYTAVYVAISGPTSQEQITQIAVRKGWRMLPCNRNGLFNVVDWVENRLLLELLPPYLQTMQTQNLEQFIAKFADPARE